MSGLGYFNEVKNIDINEIEMINIIFISLIYFINDKINEIRVLMRSKIRLGAF